MDRVAEHFPNLSKPLASGLALWSFGMILARTCSLSAVAALLAPLLGQSFNTVRERLRDTYREAHAKSGAQRAELDVTACWAPWLNWVLEGWCGEPLAIAIDATTPEVSKGATLYRVDPQCGVSRLCRADPEVTKDGKVLKATEKHAWKPEWLALLRHFRGLVPAGWTVIVLADRGLYAKGLFEAITALGWHPLLRYRSMRVNS
jgi:hypothetical protein